MLTPADIPDQVSIDCNAFPQTTVEWCWAGCCCGVAKFLGINPVPTEGKLANLLTGRSDCDVTQPPQQCIVPAGFLDIPRLLKIIGIDCIGPDYVLSLETALEEIIAKRPFMIAYEWFGGGGHVTLVNGLIKQFSQFQVSDPFFGDYKATYTELRNFRFGEVSGRWVADYGRFKKSGDS